MSVKSTIVIVVLFVISCIVGCIVKRPNRNKDEKDK